MTKVSDHNQINYCLYFFVSQCNLLIGRYNNIVREIKRYLLQPKHHRLIYRYGPISRHAIFFYEYICRNITLVRLI